jgi:hypothetical protein
MEDKIISLKSTEKTQIYIFPLNNIYAYDFNVCDDHEGKFLKIISGFKNENTFTTVYEALKYARDKSRIPEFLVYLKERIDLLPYVQKEFLTYFSDKNVDINFLAKSEEEIEIINFECELLNVSKHVNSVLLFHNDIILPEKSIIISEYVDDLLKIHLNNKNVFSIFNFLIMNDSPTYISIQCLNITLLKVLNKKLDSSPVNFYPDLILESVRQANIFLEHVCSNRTKTYEEIKKGFFDNQVKVMYIFDSKSSSKNYRKRELATSSPKILYTPFMLKNFELDNSLSLYKNHQVVLQRCPYLYFSNKIFCDELQSILDKYHSNKLLIHHMSVIDICFYRLNVYNFINEFINEIGPEIKEKLSVNLSVPFSFKFEIYENESDVHLVKQRLYELIKEKSSYPLIIKPDACTDHEMFLLLNEEGLENYLNKENFEKRKKSKIFIVQKFIAHGGLMFKNYYINNKTFTITRPSLPDLEGKTLEISHFKDGCFKFHNEFLYKKEDPSFWENIEQKQSSVTQCNKINYEALDKISTLLATKKNITLFGLDYLYDAQTNTYYLLEINYFPSYRELGSKLRDEYEGHILSLYAEQKKKITNDEEK